MGPRDLGARRTRDASFARSRRLTHPPMLRSSAYVLGIQNLHGEAGEQRDATILQTSPCGVCLLCGYRWFIL
jgi:hypothetical protein